MRVFDTWAWFFCLVFHREQTVSWAELRQASVKSPARVELSLAYSLLTVENQTKKPGPDVSLVWFTWWEGSEMYISDCELPPIFKSLKNPSNTKTIGQYCNIFLILLYSTYKAI